MSSTEYGSGRRSAASEGAGRSREERLVALARQVADCRRCERLVAWREQVARERRASFANEEYWGRPLPGFGDPHARVLLLGLAPAAHGANRTGRMFTGDRSGQFLFGALWRTGFANQAGSLSRCDGLRLSGAFVSAAVRCAPPSNRPTPQERDACLPWSVRELALLEDVSVVVCLGAFAWDAALRLRAMLAATRGAESTGGRSRAPGRATGSQPRRAKPRFAHGAELPGRDGEADLDPSAERAFGMIGCFHPSQQNTFTGRLTEPMIDAVLLRARILAGLGGPGRRALGSR
ncbi:MAG: uracil-DNA glycosylase [Solirubrobacteraceae bacterium]